MVANAFELGDHAADGRDFRASSGSTREHAPRPLPLQRGTRRVSPRPTRPRHRAARRSPTRPRWPDDASADSAAIAAGILGRIHEARLEPVEALSYYRRIEGRNRDAGDAIGSLTARSLSVPEMSIVRSAGRISQARTAGREWQSPAARRHRPQHRRGRRAGLSGRRDATVPRRNDLGSIASVELAGIRPIHQARVAVGDGRIDVAERVRPVELQLPAEGAYLVMLRGEDRFASGLVVVTPLEIAVNPSETGRLRVAVRDARTRRGVPGAQVKVIGARASRCRSARRTSAACSSPMGSQGASRSSREGDHRSAIHRAPPWLSGITRGPRPRG